jgi:hypothetical protein
MEASQRTNLMFDSDRDGAQRLAGGNGRMIELPKVDADDQKHATGFLRLHLMVNAVLERLTKP